MTRQPQIGARHRPGPASDRRPPLAPRARNRAMLVGAIAYPVMSVGMFIAFVDLFSLGTSGPEQLSPLDRFLPLSAHGGALLVVIGFMVLSLILIGGGIGLSVFMMKRRGSQNGAAVTFLGILMGAPVSYITNAVPIVLYIVWVFYQATKIPHRLPLDGFVFFMLIAMAILVHAAIGMFSWWLAAHMMRPRPVWRPMTAPASAVHLPAGAPPRPVR